MKTITVFFAMIAAPAAQAVEIPAQVPAKGSVYIVTRAATAESRALFSARLVKLSAENLHWYEDASVVRAEVPKKSLAAVRADHDVVLMLSEQNHPAQVSIFENPAPEPEAPAPPLPAPRQPAPALALQQPACAEAFQAPLISQIPQMPTPGAGMGMGQMGGQPGMGMGMGMGLMDSLAGGVATRLLNRTPSCRIAIGKSNASFGPAGGDGVIQVNAAGSCVWQAQSSVDWIKITSGSGVSGSGVVSYNVVPGSVHRSGSIMIVAASGGSPTKGKASHVVEQLR